MGILRTLFAGDADAISDLQHPRAWLLNFGGVSTVSGQLVTPENALTVPAYFAALRNLSEDLAKNPLPVYRPVGKRGKERATDHPLYGALNEEANPLMTAFSFRETMASWALAWGGGLAEFVRYTNEDGSPAVAFWPIHPSRVRRTITKSGRVWQVLADDLTNGDVGMVELDDSRVVYVHGLGRAGLEGYSVAALMAEALGIALASQKFAASFFGHGTFPSGIIKVPGKLDDRAKQHLRETWTALYGGADNAHKPAVLDGGFEFAPIGVPPGDAQFLESRQFQVEEIARFLRMPPHKIGHLARSTFSNIEHQSIEYVTDTITPWSVRIEQEIVRKCLTPEERRAGYTVKHVLQALLRGDHTTRANFYRTMVNIGAMSPNDVRELEDLNPIPGEGGDEYFIQTNMATLDQVASGEALKGKAPAPSPAFDGAPPIDPTDPVAPEDGEDPVDAIAPFRISLDADAARIVRRERGALARAPRVTPDAFRAFALAFYAEHRDFVAASTRSTALSIELALAARGHDALGKVTSAVEGFAAALWPDPVARSREVAGGSEGPLAAAFADSLWSAVVKAVEEV